MTGRLWQHLAELENLDPHHPTLDATSDQEPIEEVTREEEVYDPHRNRFYKTTRSHIALLPPGTLLSPPSLSEFVDNYRGHAPPTHHASDWKYVRTLGPAQLRAQRVLNSRSTPQHPPRLTDHP